MLKKSGLTNSSVVTSMAIGMAIASVAPTAAQRLPNRLHGPVRIDSSPTVKPRERTIKRGAPSGSEAATGAGKKGITQSPARRSSPSVATPTPSRETPLPTQRASNAPALKEQQETAPLNGIEADPEVVARPPIEQPAGEGPEATRHADERLAQLRKERFRRRAAESAQKEIEEMADQLRDRLGKEIAARRKAEGIAAELVSRASLENQIDQERDRLRTEKIQKLEKRRVLLEGQVNELTERLAAERATRQQLERDKAALTQALAAAKQNNVAAPSEANLEPLRSQIAELTRKLNAAEWARKLAEAQLRVLTRRRGTKRSPSAGQSN